MTFNDFRIAYDSHTDAIRLNDFVIQFDALWKQMRQIQLKRSKAQAPVIIENVQVPSLESCTS